MSDTRTKGPLAMTTDRVTALLDAYDAETTSLPLGHEMPTRGASTYNWRRSIVDEMRALYAALSSGDADYDAEEEKDNVKVLADAMLAAHRALSEPDKEGT